MDSTEIKYRVDLADEMARRHDLVQGERVEKLGLAPLFDAPSSPASIAMPAASTESLFASDLNGRFATLSFQQLTIAPFGRAQARRSLG